MLLLRPSLPLLCDRIRLSCLPEKRKIIYIHIIADCNKSPVWMSWQKILIWGQSQNRKRKERVFSVYKVAARLQNAIWGVTSKRTFVVIKSSPDEYVSISELQRSQSGFAFRILYGMHAIRIWIRISLSLSEL